MGFYFSYFLRLKHYHFYTQVTRDVSLMSRWMAIDLYIRQLDNLSFELSIKKCCEKLASLANEILLKG